MPVYDRPLWSQIILLLFILSSFIASRTEAANKALLIGISDYQAEGIQDLPGPRHDVDVLQQVLGAKFGFLASDITTLRNHRATRRNILRALAALRDESKAGDFVLIYFSGHGTSAFDPKMKLPLPHNSGALVPTDFAHSGTTDEKLASLVIGSRDVRPVLETMDRKQVSGMILVDSCFAENQMRAQFSSEIEPVYRTIASGVEYLDAFDAQVESRQPYPYQNFITITAAGSKEDARDEIDRSKTLDGKPHGAFTDNLLRVLGEIGSADTDNDKKVTNWELYAAIKKRMGVADYPHSPRFLPLQTEDHTALQTHAVFEVASSEPGQLASFSGLQVQVENDFQVVRDVIRKTDGIRETSQHYDLVVKKIRGTIHLLTRFGDSVMASSDEHIIAQALKQQIWIKQLIASSNSAQQFNISVRMDGYDGETFQGGQRLEFSVTSAQKAYLLVVAITPQGSLRVLYPFEEQELQPIRAHQPVRFGDICVNAPFGIDHVLAVGFVAKPSLYNHRLFAGDFLPGTPDHQQLLALLQRDHDPNQARQVTKLVSVPNSAIPGHKICE